LVEPAVLITWLGLLWITSLVMRRQLSARDEKFLTFFAFITSWAILLDIFLHDIPNPLNVYAALITSGMFGLFLFWRYVSHRVWKNARVPRLLRSDLFSLAFAGIAESLSAYMLYASGYSLGFHEAYFLAVTAVNLSFNLNIGLPSSPYLAYVGVVLGAFGIAESTGLFVMVAYRRGLPLASKGRSTLSSLLL
jgi:hypothetical protein